MQLLQTCREAVAVHADVPERLLAALKTGLSRCFGLQTTSGHEPARTQNEDAFCPASTARVALPRSLIVFLGRVVTCLTVTFPPIGYAALSITQLQHRAAEHAAVGARSLEVDFLKTDRQDSPEDIAASALYATRGAQDTISASWVVDAQGQSIGFTGSRAIWPEITARAPIRLPRFQGYFYVAASTRGVIIGTLQVAFAFLLLGLASHAYVRRFLLAALDEALRLLEEKQTALLAQQRQLEARNLQLDTALDHMSQGLCMFDRDQRVVICNKHYAQLYGLTPEQVRPGTALRDIIQLRIANGFYAGTSPDEYLHERIAPVTSASNSVQELKDGRTIAIARRPMAGGGWVTTHEDITEQRRAMAQIAYMAQHDALTDLPNRVLLRERLERALGRARRGECFAVHWLDLDGFKAINDTLGHNIGDAALKAVGERLRTCVRETDTVARFGGDEFAIVQCPAAGGEDAARLATRVIDSMAKPLVIDGKNVGLGVSIGIALAPKDGLEPDVLLRNADLALYRAKNENPGSYRFFEPEMNVRMQTRLALERDLRAALQNGELEIFYQPIFNLERHEISGFEALLRWRKPGQGMVLPADFIPLAEETGLITPIGEWVLRQACAEAATWHPRLALAVNLSPVQFRSGFLVQTVASALAASGLDPSRLELEVTESVLLQNSTSALSTLARLRDLGVRVVIDDFGTGYSSLSYLRNFPFDKIKLDRCFIRDLGKDNETAVAIMAAVARLGSALGIATTAEGVETVEQLRIVREEGFTELQGFFISPPRPAREIATLLRTPMKQEERSDEQVPGRSVSNKSNAA